VVTPNGKDVLCAQPLQHRPRGGAIVHRIPRKKHLVYLVGNRLYGLQGPGVGVGITDQK